jgi:hypothetical protein
LQRRSAHADQWIGTVDSEVLLRIIADIGQIARAKVSAMDHFDFALSAKEAIKPGDNFILALLAHTLSVPRSQRAIRS